MKTKQDFLNEAANQIANYPVVAQRYQAKDPVIVAIIESMAAMLALKSVEQDVQASEPFLKARDVTVLADAAVRGVLPFATPKLVTIAVKNPNAGSFTVNNNRAITDIRGRPYRSVNTTVINANSTVNIQAEQKSYRTINHTVSANQPFYKILVTPPADINTKIVSLSMVDSLNVSYPYKNDYLNVADGEKMFHLEVDENRNLYIVFGATGIVGYQPAAGEQFIITVTESEGDYDIDVGTKFTFVSSLSVNDVGTTLTLDSASGGTNPMDIATMREVVNYPSIYDSSAVYLNNFDFLLRRNVQDFQFLSIWNEYVEETVRGANLSNINSLFIAADIGGTDVSTSIPLKNELINIIGEADDSYLFKFKKIITETIKVTITAFVAPIYNFSDVESQIRTLILDTYDQNSAFAKRGVNKIKYRDVYKLITDNVQALQGGSGGDLEVVIDTTGNDDDVEKKNKAYSWDSTTDEVTVNFNAHGFFVGDQVYVSEATEILLNNPHIITAVSANQFVFKVFRSGSSVTTGTLTILAKPRPEKWRFVSNVSLIVNVLEIP